MRPFATSPVLAGLVAAAVSTPVDADTLLATVEALILDNLCVGASCDKIDEKFPTGLDSLKIRGNPVLILEDASSSTSSYPSNDWAIQGNDTVANGRDVLRFDDLDGGNTPFAIEAGARENTLYLAPLGRIGMGTMLPAAALHVNVDQPKLRLDSTLYGGGWEFDAGVPYFKLNTVGSGSVASSPIRVHFATPTGTLVMAGGEVTINDAQGSFDFRVETSGSNKSLFVDGTAGLVGVGTDTPAAPFHVSSPDSYSFFRLEATGAATNTAADMTFTGGPVGTGEFRVNIVDGDGFEMGVDASGVVTAKGGFKVNATSLNVPDYVFAEDYDLRPLDEVAAFIDENRHLPDVPSAARVTAEGLDMTTMQLALLRKIEELTLYTLDQQALIDRQAARVAQQRDAMTRQAETNAALAARIAALEAAAVGTPVD